ncbi:unnamed protein product [Protopolystoma xenopodis]|uniref:Uncharacterized protein n=1 Tax=Protopolystoma xenopodis TaxID=117903 RepID=A0A3S5B9N2_9PLAT|nr:unnamed protein product [Protopolystoma xenopodis]
MMNFRYALHLFLAKGGEGLAVGSPLSRGFKSHIASGRLHSDTLLTPQRSANNEGSSLFTPQTDSATMTTPAPHVTSTATSDSSEPGHQKADEMLEDPTQLANELLRGRVHASFWQSYSKRIE